MAMTPSNPSGIVLSPATLYPHATTVCSAVRAKLWVLPAAILVKTVPGATFGITSSPQLITVPGVEGLLGTTAFELNARAIAASKQIAFNLMFMIG